MYMRCQGHAFQIVSREFSQTGQCTAHSIDAKSRLKVYRCVLTEIVHDAKLESQGHVHTDNGVSPVQTAARNLSLAETKSACRLRSIPIFQTLMHWKRTRPALF